MPIVSSKSKWLKTHRGRFKQQRDNAKARGIKFKLSFDEWMDIWGDNIVNRGNKHHDLCMCRKGDKGAYKIGNVYIATNAHNQATTDPKKHISSAILTLRDVKKIRELLSYGLQVKKIARLFGISRQSISGIKAGRTWR